MGTADDLNRTTEAVVGAAIDVHRALGPGLLEAAYEAALEYELRDKGRRVERQKGLPVVYRGVELDCGYRVDLLVEGNVVVEVKAVEAISPIHTAQVLSYLKMSGCRVGLPLNFNVRLMKDGVHRVVDRFPDGVANRAPDSPRKGRA